MYYLKSNWAETGWIIMQSVRCQIKAKNKTIKIKMTVYKYLNNEWFHHVIHFIEYS
jgi:hypothetical protein